MTIGYGVCVGSWERFARNVGPWVGDAPVVAMAVQTSIAAAYNRILGMFRGTPVRAVALVHDDLEIVDPAFDEKIHGILDRYADNEVVIGVAGAASPPSTLSWWDHNPIGHQDTDGGPLDFGVRSGDACALDGSILVLSREAAIRNRFTVYEGFHGYDVDFCMTARDFGIPVIVADIDTHHHTVPGVFKTPESERAFHAADTIYRRKWRPVV